MNVSNIMTREVLIASPTQLLQDAAKLMVKADCGSIPVGENDRLIGMLTDRDIVVRAVAQGLALDKCTVRDVMSADIKYVFEDDTLEAMERSMAGAQLRRMPVLNRDKRLVGIVSLGDLALKESQSAGSALHDIAQPDPK